MKLKGTLLAVRDMDRALNFYRGVIGLRVISDFGANKSLTGGLSLQTLDTWTDFIEKERDEVSFGANAVELYFEEDDMDSLIQKFNEMGNIDYVHRLKEHAWGQKTIRIYDPDKHIIEIGENMSSVADRFAKQGMTVEQIAKRMDIEEKYVRAMLR